MRSRWLALVVFLILIGIIFFRDKKRTLRVKVKYYGTMFVEGMVGGLIIDSIGVNAGFYSFPRQPLYSLDYFTIVIPCWGVFGLLLNCLWDWFGKERFLQSMAVSILPLFVFYEGSNLITGSWIYTVPFHIVVLGWIPLGWTFAGCNRRRKVIFKIEQWKQQFVGGGIKIPIRVILESVKLILIVVMFPLMLVAMVKIIGNITSLIKERASLSDYKNYMKVMVSSWLALS